MIYYACAHEEWITVIYTGESVISVFNYVSYVIICVAAISVKIILCIILDIDIWLKKWITLITFSILFHSILIVSISIIPSYLHWTRWQVYFTQQSICKRRPLYYWTVWTFNSINAWRVHVLQSTWMSHAIFRSSSDSNTDQYSIISVRHVSRGSFVAHGYVISLDCVISAAQNTHTLCNTGNFFQ